MAFSHSSFFLPIPIPININNGCQGYWGGIEGPAAGAAGIQPTQQNMLMWDVRPSQRSEADPSLHIQQPDDNTPTPTIGPGVSELRRHVKCEVDVPNNAPLAVACCRMVLSVPRRTPLAASAASTHQLVPCQLWLCMLASRQHIQPLPSL